MSENEKKEGTVAETVQAEVKSDGAETKTGGVVTVDPEAEKRGGTKEAATNSEAMAVEKEKVVEAEKNFMPSFFVKKADRHVVEVDILSSKRDGRIMSVSRTGLGLDFAKDFPYLTHSKVSFEFSLPNYEDMSTYRQRSATWRKEAQQVIVDKLQMRNFFLVWHLKEWSLTDDKGEKVRLEHEDTGALTDESVAKVYAANPTLLDVVLTLFEKDILLV